MSLNNTVTIRTDLKVNIHDVLDFETKYKLVLKQINELFGGYISQHHFVEFFGKEPYGTKRHMKDLCSKLVADDWLGTTSMGKYKMLYLKRKSRICIEEKTTLSDLPIPSVRQIIRSLLIAELLLISKTPIKELKHLGNDVYLYAETEGWYKVFVLDITKRNHLEYLSLLESIVADKVNLSDQNKNIVIAMFSYSPDRYATLKKWFNYNSIRDFKKAYSKDDLYHNPHVESKIMVELNHKLINLLHFFNNNEPKV